MSFGWGLSKSKTRSKESVWDNQAPFLSDLYRGGEGLLEAQQQGLSQQMTSAGLQGINQMAGINQATTNPWQQQLAGGASNNPKLAAYYEQLMNGQGTAMDTLTDLQNPEMNPYMQRMGQYGLDQFNDNFNRNVMPGINANAAFTGGLGGSRQGVAQGIAAGDLAGEQANFLNNFYGSQYQSDMDRALGAASTMGNLQGAAAQGNSALRAQQDVNSLNALGYTPQMLANQGAQATGYQALMAGQWSPYEAYSNILGPPVVLGRSKGDSWGASGSYSYGGSAGGGTSGGS